MWVWSSDRKRLINIDLFHEIKLIQKEITWRGKKEILIGVYAVAYTGEDDIEVPLFTRIVPSSNEEAIQEALKHARVVYKGIADSLRPVRFPSLL